MISREMKINRAVPSILIVDDEPFSLNLLETYLIGQKYNVFSAADGHEALSLLENNEVDLVISDLVMPGMDGVQLMLSAKELQPTLPFIVFTAEGSVESAVSAIKLGALDYLEKPFNLKTAVELAKMM